VVVVMVMEVVEVVMVVEVVEAVVVVEVGVKAVALPSLAVETETMAEPAQHKISGKVLPITLSLFLNVCCTCICFTCISFVHIVHSSISVYFSMCILKKTTSKNF